MHFPVTNVKSRPLWVFLVCLVALILVSQAVSEEKNHENTHLEEEQGSSVDEIESSLDPSHYRTVGLNSADTPHPTQSTHSAPEDSDSPSLDAENFGFSYDESDRATVVRLLNENVAVGMITTKSYHPRIIESMNTWWNYEEFKDLVTVFSDTTNNESVVVGRSIANLVDTGCDSSYNYGIWCKNTYMLEYWRTNPKFSNVKWFVRVMDDTYAHLENILHEVSKHDHRKKMVIGEKWCKQGGCEFPVGGCGFIISRAVLEDYDWSVWSLSVKKIPAINEFVDDMAWGEYLRRRGIEITHHGGIHQFPMYPGMPLYRYWMQFHKSTYDANHPWNMDFRPLLLHQQGLPIPMPFIHQNLHEIKYTPVLDSNHKDYITMPKCFCNSDKLIRKCYHSKELLDSGACHRPDDNLQCIAPATWKWHVPSYERNPYAFPSPHLQAPDQATQFFAPPQTPPPSMQPAPNQQMENDMHAQFVQLGRQQGAQEQQNNGRKN